MAMTADVYAQDPSLQHVVAECVFDPAQSPRCFAHSARR